MSSSEKNTTLKEKHEVTSKRLLDIFQSTSVFRDMTEIYSCLSRSGLPDEPLSAEFSTARHPLVLKAINKLKKQKKDALSSDDIKVLNKRFMSGHLPRSKPIDKENDEDSDDDDDDDADNSYNPKTVYHATNKSALIEKIVKVQINLLVAIRNYILKYASRYGNSWLRSMIPTSQIATLISFVLYTYILNAEFLLFFLPLFFFVSSFIVLVVSTLRLLRGEKRFKEFMAWSELLASVDSSLNLDQAKDNYFKKHISPLISLLPAVIINVMSFSIASVKVLPISELALGSIILCFANFYSFYPSFNKHSMYGIALHVLASLLEDFKRYSSDPVGIFSFPLVFSKGFQLNFSLSVLARFGSFAFILATSFQSRFRSRWVGVIRGVAPILYVLLWWEMFCLFFVDASFTGLFRAGLGLVVLFCSIPVTIILFFYAIFRWLFVFQFLKITLLTLALVLPLFYFIYRRPQCSYKDVLKYLKFNFGPALQILAIILLVSTLLAVVAFYRPAGLQVYNSNLTWMNYEEICLSEGGNKVYTKRLCYQLNGYHINWTGIVKDVRVVDIDNKFESVLRILPGFLAEWLCCVYGEKFQEKPCSDTSDLLNPCFAKRPFLRDCHLDYYNKYSFIVSIKPTGEGESNQIKLQAGNKFTALVFLLRPDLKIAFKGELQADKATVDLKHLRILDKSIKTPPRHVTELNFRISVDRAFKTLFQFFFSPFVTFTQESDYDE